MLSEEDAKTQLHRQMMEISDRQFEQLCKIAVSEIEDVIDAELTPKSGDGGIDVIGYVGNDLYRETFGVQSKQYEMDISGAAIRSFDGALSGQNHRWGVFVTTSDYKSSAIDESENRAITLINGDELAGLMIKNELGVIETENRDYIIDAEFWDIFDLTKGEGLIPSSEVPQANDIDVLPIVLEGMSKGYRYKPDIASYMMMQTGDSWQPRQGDYYATAGWVLGYVHKDTIGEYDARKMRKWGLTSDGERFVELIHESDMNDLFTDEAIREDFAKHLRQMEISRRLCEIIRTEGPLSHDALKNAAFNEVELNEETSDRRVSTISQWMADFLPEVARHHDERSYRWEYIEKPITDY